MTHQTTLARVESITPLTDSILQLILAPDHYIDYQAGQYLQIITEQEEMSYSIANAPLGSRKYELHIRHRRDNPHNQQLLADIKQKGTVLIRLPLGECSLNHLHPHQPILFIAQGTGFAPIKAMIEQLLAEGEPRLFELYWSARSQSDLYLDGKVVHWQTHAHHFQYFSHVSDAGDRPLITTVLDRHPQDIHQWQLVISGPFDMVYDTRDTLLTYGVHAENLFSDAFERKK